MFTYRVGSHKESIPFDSQAGIGVLNSDTKVIRSPKINNGFDVMMLLQQYDGPLEFWTRRGFST